MELIPSLLCFVFLPYTFNIKQAEKSYVILTFEVLVKAAY
jgi:hypothetical protein